MNKYNKGDIIRIRRHKDLCCEYEVFADGYIIGYNIFHPKLIPCCGRSYKIQSVTDWHGDDAYYLSFPKISGWWFKEYLLEEVIMNEQI